MEKDHLGIFSYAVYLRVEKYEKKNRETKLLSTIYIFSIILTGDHPIKDLLIQRAFSSSYMASSTMLNIKSRVKMETSRYDVGLR